MSKEQANKSLLQAKEYGVNYKASSIYLYGFVCSLKG
jgi:hypothetical protein